jgi:kynurenine formamidase
VGYRKDVAEITVAVVLAEPMTKAKSRPCVTWFMMLDLTQPLDHDTPVYPGDPPFSSHQACSVPNDGYSVHSLSCSSHAGTHIDAPSHFFVDGKTIDRFPPSAFIRPALVIDVSQKNARQCITWDSIAPAADRICPGTAVLFRTGWSRFYNDHSHSNHHHDGKRGDDKDKDEGNGPDAQEYFDHPWIAKDVAQRLVALGVRLIGTDTMSPDQSPTDVTADNNNNNNLSEEEEEDFGVHRVILGAGGLIVENLTNLDALLDAQDVAGPSEEVVVSLLPLKISGCDASPVRAVAWVQPRGLFS